MYDGIYGIPRGGSIVASHISQLTTITQLSSIPPLEELEKLKWKGKKILIIDDISDSGKTLNNFSQNKVFDTAIIHLKTHSKHKPTYYVEKVDNNDWIQYPYEIENKDETIERNIVRILEFIGEDPNREGLVSTPNRVIRMYNKLFYGYKKKLCIMNEKTRNRNQDENIIPITVFKVESNDMLIRNTKFHSCCEHHLVDFSGTAYVGIIPNKLLLGMNKIDKIVKYFSARLQIQERLTKQIVDWINENIKPKGVMVVIKANHLCAELQDDNGDFITSAVRGAFENQETKMEFLELVKVSK